MKGRTCYICKELVNKHSRPSINKKRYYLCVKEKCNIEFNNFRFKIGNIKLPRKNVDINKSQNLFKKKHINNYRISKISPQININSEDKTIRNYIYENIGKNSLHKQSIYLYRVNTENIKYIDIISKKYGLNRTKTFNMIIEIFKNKYHI